VPEWQAFGNPTKSLSGTTCYGPPDRPVGGRKNSNLLLRRGSRQKNKGEGQVVLRSRRSWYRKSAAQGSALLENNGSTTQSLCACAISLAASPRTERFIDHGPTERAARTARRDTPQERLDKKSMRGDADINLQAGRAAPLRMMSRMPKDGLFDPAIRMTPQQRRTNVCGAQLSATT